MSAAALSWNSMLNITKVELELISDAYMYLLFEKGMRGGVSCICKRYSKANNDYLKSKHIIYLDANNSSGYAKFHQTVRFKSIDPKIFDSNKHSSKCSKGCVLEADLEYPKKLPKLHNDYALAPDKIEMVSNYELKISDFYNIPIGTVKKLEPNFFDKENCALHFENLQLYLRLGLKLKNTSLSKLTHTHT